MNKSSYADIDLPETEDAAYAFIAEYCDEAEFLSNERAAFEWDRECLLGTELEPLLPALVGVREGSSWGMRGALFRFRMTEDIAALLKKNGLDSVIDFFGERYRFENAALYRRGKKVYSCCSHEGLTDIDAEFSLRLANICCEEIEKSAAYAAAKTRVCALPAKEKRSERLWFMFSVLTHFNNYVEDDIGVTIHGCPEYDCDFAEFRAIAKELLSEEVYGEIARASRFSDLARKTEKPSAFLPGKVSVTCDVRERKLYSAIGRELFFLQYAADRAGLLAKRKKSGCPAVIIRK